MYGEKGLDYSKAAEELSEKNGTDNVIFFAESFIDEQGSFQPLQIIDEAKNKYGDKTEETSLLIRILLPYLSVPELDKMYISLVNDFRMENGADAEATFSRRSLLRDMREAAITLMLALLGNIDEIAMEEEN